MVTVKLKPFEAAWCLLLLSPSYFFQGLDSAVVFVLTVKTLQDFKILFILDACMLLDRYVDGCIDNVDRQTEREIDGWMDK